MTVTDDYGSALGEEDEVASGSDHWRQELCDYAGAAALRRGVLPEWVSQEVAGVTETLEIEVFISDSGDPGAPGIRLEFRSDAIRFQALLA